MTLHRATCSTVPAGNSISPTEQWCSLTRIMPAQILNSAFATRRARSGRSRWGSRPSQKLLLLTCSGRSVTTPTTTISFPKRRWQALPHHLQRGQHLVGSNGIIENVRLERHSGDPKKIGNWKWKHNPFSGTRKFNGLRVMMALMNSWDLKDENNAIYERDADGPRKIYAISDLGASFGTTGYSWTQTGQRQPQVVPPLQIYQQNKTGVRRFRRPHTTGPDLLF